MSTDRTVSSGMNVDDCVLTSVAGGVATVTMNRPTAMNALNMELKSALAATFARLHHDSSVRAIVLTGAGKAFCAGGDISEMDPDRGVVKTRERMQNLLHQVVLPLANFRCPVIAAVNGHAHGLGFSLALASDLIVAGRSAVVSLPFSRMGLGPDGCAAFFVPRIVGLQKAKELMFFGDRLTADEALEMRLVNRVVADEELEATVSEMARRLAEGPTVAYSITKRLLNDSFAKSIEQVAEFEALSQSVAMSSSDHREGVEAFMERRPARYTGA